MKKIVALILVLFSLFVCTFSAFAVDINESEKRIFENEDTLLPYRLILPEGYNSSSTYPVLVFLHGAGERGDDNELQFVNSVQNIADSLPECIIVVPQCSLEEQWVDTPWEKGAYSIDAVPESNELVALMQLLDDLQKELSIDADRIYASGLSMGGFGAWDLMMRHNDYFAAGILVCGGGDVSQAEALKDTPLFVFHGSDDTVVPVSGSRNVVEAIEDAGGELVTYIEYEGESHWIWDKAFAHEGLFEQLLTHKLTDRYPDMFKEEEPVTSETISKSPESDPAYSEEPSSSVLSDNVSSEIRSSDAVSDSISSDEPVLEIPATVNLGHFIPIIAAVVVVIIIVVLIAKKKK